MHDHYYHIKKQCRKKQQPLYKFKIDPNGLYDIGDLKSQFSIGSKEELQETSYILINEDGIRIPQSKDSVDAAIA